MEKECSRRGASPAVECPAVRERLEYLRGELRAERISYFELSELQSLVDYIDSDDVELLEAAGVPEKDYSIPEGVRVRVCAHSSEPGKGLSYPEFEGALTEWCNGAGWDVVDVLADDGERVSVYSFDVAIDLTER